MTSLTESRLYEMADELSLKWWGVKYDGLIELKNRRWKNINGRFCAPLASQDIPPIIEMCKKRNAERTEEEIKRTLLHELVHWRLFVLEIPYDDTSKEFIREAIRVGASFSQTAKAKRAYEEYIGTGG